MAYYKVSSYEMRSQYFITFCLLGHICVYMWEQFQRCACWESGDILELILSIMCVLGIKFRLSRYAPSEMIPWPEHRNRYRYAENVPKRNTWICCSASTLLNGAEWVTHGTAAVTSVSDPWFLPRLGWLSNLLMCCVGRPTMGVSTPTCRLFSDHYSLKDYRLLSISYLEIIKIYGRICAGDI